jgi:hypothetical protein
VLSRFAEGPAPTAADARLTMGTAEAALHEGHELMTECLFSRSP